MAPRREDDDGAPAGMTARTAHAGSGDSRPVVWVLVPYAIDGDRLDGDTFETPETKTELALAFDTLRLPWVWQPVVPGSLDHIVSQLVSSSRTRRRAGSRPAI